MEKYLREHFHVPVKNQSEAAQHKWRAAVTIVKNRRRRFRDVPDLDKREEDATKRRSIQEKFSVSLYLQDAAFRFLDAAAKKEEYKLTEEVISAGYSISPDELASIARTYDTKAREVHGGVEGISRKIRAPLDNGVSTEDLQTRQKIYGINKYTEKPSRSFWMFVWDVLHDLTLIILMVCALISVVVGWATEGFPKGMYDGLGIMLSILLVVLVTAVSDYRQSLQFKELDKEKKKIFVHVTRNGSRQKVLIYDLVVGDIVHLSIGDQVPADGLFISGYSLLIDESCLFGESDPVYITREKPFLLAGTKVLDGSAKMLITAVGKRTELGRSMSTLSQGGEDETPLQVKLNGVATIIGKIGATFACLTYLVLIGRFLIEKGVTVGLLKWYLEDSLTVLNYFAIAVSIIVVAVPEGLPLAVTLSLAYAMKKLMDDKALVRHLAACETMGSASCICTDKTGTLTTNHMVLDKIWLCDVTKSVNAADKIENLNALISENVVSTLLQGIFENSSSEVVKGKDGKNTILGMPTETALLEFGLKLEGEKHPQHRACEKVKVEPFNSDKKRMSVIVNLPKGGYRAFCKGASEIIVGMCDKMIESNGEVKPLEGSQMKETIEIINTFASDALRTLCLAFVDMEGYNESEEIPTEGYTLISIFGIKNPVRPGVKEALKMCIDAGIMVRMVTGDNINTAKAIAKECGILTADGLAIEGPDFRSKSKEEMKELIPKIQVIAQSLPKDKRTLVTNLRDKPFQEVVAVTGDSSDDARALKESDIGLAMGIAGTEVAKESADVIVLDDNFATIVNVVRWGRAVNINIQKFVQFQLTVIVVALVVNFVSACITGTSLLTAVQLLWINVIMDTLGAVALLTEPPNDEMMKRPPVQHGDSFITRTMWRNIIGQALYQLIVLGILMFAGKRIFNISGPDSDLVVNTIIFNSFVFCQVFNEINSREMEKINVFRGIFKNWVFSAIIFITVIFQVVIVEFLGTFASTVPLSWQFWVLSVVLGLISLIISAILKCIPVENGRMWPGEIDSWITSLNKACCSLVLLWGGTVLLGGFLDALQMMDFVSVILMCLYAGIRYNCNRQVLEESCRQVLEESMMMHVFPAISSVVVVAESICSVVVVAFSVKQLVSQHFGEIEEPAKATRNLALNVFYVMALTDALLNFAINTLYYGLGKVMNLELKRE